ncbi:ParA family protein [Synechocystis salina LEGE 06155]|nr:ParA family protein [Synechocystis salina LEGE 06155]
MIIAVCNQKGGVAKTTSTLCLGGLLSKSKKVLLIDLDPQGNLTTGAGIEVEEGQATTYEVITEQCDLKMAIATTRWDGLDVLPADITLAKGETEILGKVGNFYLLKEQVEPIKKEYDHILIDCPPSLGLLTLNALAMADYVLVPVQCQFFALKGLASLLETIASVQKRLNSNIKVLGVLPTMFEQTVMSRDVIASLEKRFGKSLIFPPVPKSIRFAEANLAGEPIHIYANDPKLTHPYKTIIKSLEA